MAHRKLTKMTFLQALGWLLVAAAIPLGSGPVALDSPAEKAPEAESFIEPTAELVMHLDCRTLRQSDLVFGMREQLMSIPGLEEKYRLFVTETGLDPWQDLDTLLMISRGPQEDRPADLLIIAHGRLGPSLLLDRMAEQSGRQTTTTEGVLTWEGSPISSSGEAATDATHLMLAQPDETTLLFGTADRVRRGLESWEEFREGGFLTGAEELLAGLDKSAPMWAVLDSPSLVREFMGGLTTEASQWSSSATSPVSTVRVMAWPNRGLDIRLLISARDPESAELLEELARGLVAAARLQAKDRDMSWFEKLGQVAIETDRDQVKVEMGLPAAWFVIGEGEEGLSTE